MFQYDVEGTEIDATRNTIKRLGELEYNDIRNEINHDGNLIEK